MAARKKTESYSQGNGTRNEKATLRKSCRVGANSGGEDDEEGPIKEGRGCEKKGGGSTTEMSFSGWVK